MKNKPHFWNSFRNFYLCFLIIFLSDTLPANELQVHNIPDSLKKQANSVVRYYRHNITITKQLEMHSNLEWAITVFNKSGDEHISTVVHYGSSDKISDVQASIYNAAGELIKKFKKNETRDRNAVMQGSVFVDDRIQYIDYTPTQYPYTFVFKVDRKSKNTAFIPEWVPLGYSYQSVEKSAFQLNYPPDWTLRASEKNFEAFGVVKNNKQGFYSVNVNNIPALIPEHLSPSHHHFLPSCLLSLNHFSLEGIQGTVNNWNDFGNWYRRNMLFGHDLLPEKTKLELKSRTSGISDPLERARIAYEFMQSRTRYINVSIGIGGWKPMTVAEVDHLGYGDCKALSFYTMALLDAVEVPSAYAVVFAGNKMKSIDTSNFSVQGNHVIVCIPLPDTTVWLETTSQQTPFGFLGSFTDNRYVISMEKDTTRLIKTLNYPDSLNIQYSETMVYVDVHGGIKATLSIQSKGLLYDSRDHLMTMKQHEKEEYYKEKWGHLQSVQFSKLMLEPDKSKISFNEQIEMSALAYGTISGNRMFVTPNVFNRFSNVVPRYAQRRLPFEIKRGYMEKDVIHIVVPEGYGIESMPKEIEISGTFGYYKSSLVPSDNEKGTLRYERTLLIKSGWHEPELYDQFYQFVREVSKHDQAGIALIKLTP